MQLYFARMCPHESLPPGRSGGGGEHATHHEPDLCGDCAFLDACMRHIKMLWFWYSNIYACITHVHTYVWGTYMKWLSLYTLPCSVIIDGLYIRGPAWTSITSTNNAREVTMVDSSSLGSHYRIYHGEIRDLSSRAHIHMNPYIYIVYAS